MSSMAWNDFIAGIRTRIVLSSKDSDCWSLFLICLLFMLLAILFLRLRLASPISAKLKAVSTINSLNLPAITRWSPNGPCDPQAMNICRVSFHWLKFDGKRYPILWFNDGYWLRIVFPKYWLVKLMTGGFMTRNQEWVYQPFSYHHLVRFLHITDKSWSLLMVNDRLALAHTLGARRKSADSPGDPSLWHPRHSATTILGRTHLVHQQKTKIKHHKPFYQPLLNTINHHGLLKTSENHHWPLMIFDSHEASLFDILVEA